MSPPYIGCCVYHGAFSYVDCEESSGFGMHLQGVRGTCEALSSPMVVVPCNLPMKLFYKALAERAFDCVPLIETMKSCYFYDKVTSA